MKEGWQTKTLGELCEIELGKTPARANTSLWDKNRETSNVWLSIADLLKAKNNIAVDSKEYLSDAGAATCKPVTKGTLLVSFKLTLGRLAFAGRDLFTNEAIAALTILSEKELSKEFLFHYLSFFDWTKAAEHDIKLKGLTLNKAKLKTILIAFPSRAEQQQIVALLDEAFEALATAKANAEQNIKNARALFESHLDSIFSQNGKNWKQNTLEEIAMTFGRGKSKHRPRNDPKLYGGEYPFIQTGDIRNAEHLISEYSQTYNEAGLAQSKLWPKGTICITIAANIAETAILSFDACFPDSVIGIVANPEEAEVGFVEYLLQSFKARIQAQGKGSAQANINLGTFEDQKFPFPPVADQKRIVARLDSLRAETQHLISIYERKLAALEELKTSLLHQAFSGEL
jgi:type I restriction enzyme S subunit